MSARDFASLTHSDHATLLRWWHYTDTFAVANFVGKDSRIVIKLAVRNGDHCYWHEPLPPWPLYRAAVLAERPDVPVLVLQSEKAAEAAARLFADHVCVTWPGGSNAVNQADVLALLGRDVVLWPENDGRGATAMARLQVRLRGVARAVAVVDVPRAWPTGWDVAWTLPSGATADTLRAMLHDAGAGFRRAEPREEPGGMQHRDDAVESPPPCMASQASEIGEEAPDDASDTQDDNITPSAIDDGGQEPEDQMAVHMPQTQDDAQMCGGIAYPQHVTADPAPEPGEDFCWSDPACEARESTVGSRDRTAAPGDGWPVPNLAVLDGRRPDLPAFPVHVLPPFWRAWTRDAARHADAPVDGVALSLLTVAAGLIGTARCIAPTPSQAEPCILWTALVGPRAATGMDTVLRLVGALDRGLEAANIAARCRDTTAREQARAEGWWWREGVRGAVANRRTAPQIPVAAQEPPPFAPRRLLISDTAIDAVADALQGNPHGTLLVRGALDDWLSQVAASRGEDRERWLGAWSADRWVVPRKGRVATGSGRLLSFRADDGRVIDIARAAVSVLGAIRSDSITAALAGGADRVAAQVLFSWPQEAAVQRLSDTSPPADDAATAALARLRDVAQAGRDVPLAADALAWFDDFRQAHHRKAGALDGWTADWWRQGLRTIMRLAGVLTLIDWATRPSGTAEPASVSAPALKAAASLWLEYLWPHAQAVRRIGGGSDQERHARKVLHWLRAQGGSVVSREDLRSRALGRTCDATTTQRIADSLVSAGWLRPIEISRTGAGRRPVRWTVNPTLREMRDA